MSTGVMQDWIFTLDCNFLETKEVSHDHPDEKNLADELVDSWGLGRGTSL
jgi:hypothetical protein